MTAFKKGDMLNRMLVLATNSHAGQMDKGGNPYILHPLSVMNMLEGDDEELKCIALGHDIVEDCGITYAYLQENFTKRVVDGIKGLTKVPGETHEEYKQKIMSNPDAVKVKICDLRHNTDIRRLRGTAPKDMARTEKYFHLYLELIEADKEKHVKD